MYNFLNSIEQHVEQMRNEQFVQSNVLAQLGFEFFECSKLFVTKCCYSLMCLHCCVMVPILIGHAVELGTSRLISFLQSCNNTRMSSKPNIV